MTINYTTLLGLAKPVTGTESGAWGDVVNDQITSLVEDAIANAASISVTSGDVTLTDNNGSSDQARMAILLVTGSPGVSRNIVAPSTSKWYIVKNGSNAAVVLKGSATTGVTIPTGSEVLAFWNGSDFEIAGMVGPSTSTDNAVARFDGTTGKIVQNSSVVIDDSNNITGIVDETLSGNLNFTGSAKRITGDFSNATVADRLTFQTSTVNGFTTVPFAPNGTGTGSAIRLNSSSDVSNASTAVIIAGGGTSSMSLQSGITGSGSFLPMTFYTGGSERMRIDTSGNVGIGTTSPITKLHVVGGNATVQSSTSGDGNIRLTNTGASYLIGMLGSLGSTALSFYDINAGQERMRIDSSGNLLVGTTDSSIIAGVGIKAIYSATNPYFGVVSSDTTNGASSYHLYSTGAGAFRFYVGLGGTVFATSTSISAISDQRLKENIQDLDVGLNAVMALRPRKFDWKAGKGKDKKGDRGWIAQEFEQVFPDLIDEWKDPAPDGEEPYKAVNADLLPVLTKAIQEQQAIIESLTARIAALEAKGA